MISLQIPEMPTAQVFPDSVPSVKEELAMMKDMPFDDFLNSLVSMLVKFAINLGIAILIFYIGRYIIRKLYKFLTELMIKRGVDRSLSTFVLSTVKMVLYFILIVTVIGVLGIETTSFLALFASAGIAIGMALSGTLQNFAGGVMILMLKPYKVGDYIEAQGYMGTVREIQIFHTIISTPDNKAIIIPNGGLSTGTINNWSREEYRRVDWTVGISYGDDIRTARDTILEIFKSNPDIIFKFEDESERIAEECARQPQTPAMKEVCTEIKENTSKPGFITRLIRRHKNKKSSEELQRAADEMLQSLLSSINPAPVVVVDELGDSAVVLKARAWTRTSNYWSVYYDISEKIYEQLPKAGISFPFPQMDVHINPGEAAKA